MSSYRLYFIGRDGRFEKAVQMEHPDDESAIAEAKTLAEGRPVELWNLDRRVEFDAEVSRQKTSS